MFVLSLWCVLLCSIHAGSVNKQYHNTDWNIARLFFLCLLFCIQTIWSDRNTSWAELWGWCICRTFFVIVCNFFKVNFLFCLCWTNAPNELFCYFQIFTILVLKIPPRTAINTQEFTVKVPCSTRLAWHYIYATLTRHWKHFTWKQHCSNGDKNY